MHNLRSEIHKQELTLQNQSLLIMRRASVFNKLYEAAVIKDTDSVAATPTSASQTSAPQTSAKQGPPLQASAPDPTSRQLRARKPSEPERPVDASHKAQSKKTKTQKKLTNGQLAEILRQHADADLTKFKLHPSLKWTWGADLNEEEIRHLFRAADKNYQVPHSAYDYSLEDGNMHEQDSGFPSMPRSGHCSSIGDKEVVPELHSDDAPGHFHRFPLCHLRSVVPEGHLPIGGGIFPYSTNFTHMF